MAVITLCSCGKGIADAECTHCKRMFCDSCVYNHDDRIGEVDDSATRTYTFDELVDNIVPIIKDAIRAADAKHGPLTADRCRAFTILTGEVGEVAECVLGTTGGSRGKTDDELSIELVQVAATAILMLIPLIAHRLPELEQQKGVH